MQPIGHCIGHYRYLFFLQFQQMSGIMELSICRIQLENVFPLKIIMSVQDNALRLFQLMEILSYFN